jgi:SAM-dependent methyltransferase
VKPTERFGDRAGAYAAHRPGYPDEAIDAVLEGLGDPRTLIVADVGAGTGISSRALAERGVGVIAIEPNASMRANAAGDPRVAWREGTGEATGLGDNDVDIAATFQAFHWFATPAGLAELRRIARKRAALVQYERDETDPFGRDYGDIVRRFATDDTEALRMRALETFAAFPDAQITRAAFLSSQSLDLDGLLGRAASSSYLPTDGAEADAMRVELRALFERYARGDRIAFTMTTYVLRADW